MADSEPFIVAGPPDDLLAVLQLVKADPGLQLVSVSGPPNAPERIVVLMTKARADELRGEFDGRLIVESDAPVNPAG